MEDENNEIEEVFRRADFSTDNKNLKVRLRLRLQKDLNDEEEEERELSLDELSQLAAAGSKYQQFKN